MFTTLFSLSWALVATACAAYFFCRSKQLRLERSDSAAADSPAPIVVARPEVTMPESPITQVAAPHCTPVLSAHVGEAVPLDRLLRRIVHEMRTPLNAMLGSLSMLEEGELRANQVQLMRMIRLGSDNLLSLLDDLQRLSRIEAGLEQVEVVDFSVLDWVEGVVREVSVRVSGKQVDLVYCIDEATPSHLRGDVRHLRHLLESLVVNAIKFTRRGEIVIRLSVDVAHQGGMQMQVSVRDTGIGISRDHLAHIFEPVISDEGDTEETVMSGFGLYLSRKLCRLMGGDMWAESKEYVGSTFGFWVPIQSAAVAETGDAEGHGCAALLRTEEVWVLSKSNAFAESVSDHLRTCRIPTTRFSDVRSFLGAGESLGGRCCVGVIDGDFWAEPRSRKEGSLEDLAGCLTPLVFVVSEISRAHITGHPVLCRMPHLDKPLLRGAFLEELSRAQAPKVVNAPSGEMPADLSVTGSDRNSLRILVAEDNKINQQVTLMMLNRLGFQADIAEDGFEVLERFLATAYDVVLMDVNMPNKNGIEATRELFDRYPEGNGRPTVIALTAAVTAATQQACREAGMKGFISKPLKMSVLQRALESISTDRPVMR